MYCRDCLAGYVNAPNNESMKASCPTCRTPFSLATPDLAFLPKKYHEWIMPNVRRVYLDSTRQNDLEKKIKKLQKDQETLMKQCERHMAAARAQAEGEKAARDKAAVLERQLLQISEQLSTSNAVSHRLVQENDLLAQEVDGLKVTETRLRRKYEALKKIHAGDHGSPSLGRRKNEYAHDYLLEMHSDNAQVGGERQCLAVICCVSTVR
ncbi:hypothetical protein H0H92_006903 [Tricholoma furcatifolium]|nr:hypothetical protein H0H92_006903 [Tricholoma furcatifolium]